MENKEECWQSSIVLSLRVRGYRDRKNSLIPIEKRISWDLR